MINKNNYTLQVLKKHLAILSHPYLKWEGEIAESVIVQQVDNVPDLSMMLNNNYFNRFEPELRACYYNAYTVTMHCPRVKYVEGYYMMPNLLLPLEHAWNEWRGVQFDVTAEIRSNSHFFYLQLVKLSKEQMREFNRITGEEGCVVHNAHNFYEWMQIGKLFPRFQVLPPTIRKPSVDLSKYLKVKATN